MVTRCYEHKDAARLPACAVCQRLAVERRIVKKVVDALLAAGYFLNVNNGGETNELPQFTRDRRAVVAVMMETGEDYLVARNAGGQTWVRFVYGNSGWDVICDYGMTLESVLASVNAYVDSLQ